VKHAGFLCAFVPLCLLAFNVTGLAQLPSAAPASVGMSASQLAHIDEAVQADIAKHQLPGAVVLVGRQGKIVWRKAYGNRALEPQTEPMTADTIFDMASLTKVVATATSMMILVERGQVRLGDPVSRYIPEFAAAGKRGITVEQLMTHRSGFQADNDVEDYQQGPEKAFQKIWNLAPVAAAGSRFVYSDVNYIVLAELVRRVSGKPLDEFAAENIYRPLGMKETGFKPAASLQPRIAPTEKRGDHWMRGEVHDPRAYLLGGVAGHAGLFSTVNDLAIFCQMVLDKGSYHGVRVLSPLGVTRMTEARVSGGNASDGNARGLGWDINTSYSSNRGDLFPVGSFGHTGFTGTSIWIDPATETFVVFLSNRVHPALDPKQPQDVSPLRSKVASIVAASIVAPPYSTKPSSIYEAPATLPGGTGAAPPRAAAAPALNGIDVLARDGFALLKGRRVGLITNQTGRDRDSRSTIDLLKAAPGVTLVSLFSPEHGIRGLLDEKVSDSVDEKTGLPIYSLYADTRKPTPEMLKGIDTLVYDIQDVGARFYTYISTLGLTLEEAAKNNIRFVVLDRVNPIDGRDVEGPLADADKLSFTAYHSIPVRHGMTVGELAQLYNGERGLHADLHVVKVENWQRGEWFDETGLLWTNPSPNMRSVTEAALYPGVALVETTNVSVGRGTNTPFELVGAPWIDGRKLAAALNESRLSGVRFVPVRFTPNASTHKDADCGGVNIVITDRAQFEPVTTGLEIAVQLVKLYPRDFAASGLLRLLASQTVYDALRNGADARALRQLWESDLANFRIIRSKYLLY
jgi:uncharacterized protein YbbC (DUF1343 family)/CubicO group peptidase (beta-lactamase class C family)